MTQSLFLRMEQPFLCINWKLKFLIKGGDLWTWEYVVSFRCAFLHAGLIAVYISASTLPALDSNIPPFIFFGYILQDYMIPSFFRNCKTSF